MSNFRVIILWLILLIPILSCSNQLKVIQSEPSEIAKQPKTCPIVESGKWHAWLDKYEQKSGLYRLNISGEILLPNPAFNLEWSKGPTDRMNPPGLRLFLKPVATDTMAIQVLTSTMAKYEMETPIPNYRHVSIYCEGKLLGKVSDVLLTD